MAPLFDAGRDGRAVGPARGVPAGVARPAGRGRPGPDAAPRGVLTVRGRRPAQPARRPSSPTGRSSWWSCGPGSRCSVREPAGWSRSPPVGWPRCRGHRSRACSGRWPRCPSRRAPIGALCVGALAGLLLAGQGNRGPAGRHRRPRRGHGCAAAAPIGRWPGRRSGPPSSTERHLVLLGTAAEELARERSDLRADRLARGLHRPRLAVAGRRRSVRGRVPALGRRRTAGLPAAAHALLRARQRALEQGHHDDARQLRDDLARFGVVVREERRRQFWRLSRLRPEVPESDRHPNLGG